MYYERIMYIGWYIILSIFFIIIINEIRIIIFRIYRARKENKYRMLIS